MSARRLRIAVLALACAFAPVHAAEGAEGPSKGEYYGTSEPFAADAVYFVLTDRFVNGDPSNDHRDQGGSDPELRTFDRPVPGATSRNTR